MADENALPRMKTAKQMYDAMLTEPAKPSMAHTTKAMSMADKMFEAPKAKKMAKGGCCRGDGIAQRGKTKGRFV
jgi:hypothetical protein